MSRTGIIVPHHRVPLHLHAAARDRAAGSGVSLSAVAVAGLEAYTRPAPSAVRSRAKRRTGAGRIGGGASLPSAAAQRLQRMSRDSDPELLSYMVALHRAGWSFAAIAEPLGISRQAAHLRVSRWDDTLGLGLPDAPRGPGRVGPTALGGQAAAAVYDWSIWVPRPLYALASEQAKSLGEPMRTVMARILEDFVGGRLEVGKKAREKGSEKR